MVLVGSRLYALGTFILMVAAWPLLPQGWGRANQEAAPVIFRSIQWQRAALFDVPVMRDNAIAQIQEQYLKTLNNQGIARGNQGVWVQSMWGEFAGHQGQRPLSAASLTKVATTIAVLSALEPDYRFTTEIYGHGQQVNGVWEGDLVVMGEGDPMLVWEEGFAMAKALEELGLKAITGDLVIVGKLFMNYQQDPQKSGQLLQQSFNSSNWPPAAALAYNSVANKFSQPQLKMGGQVRLSDRLPQDSQLLLSHQSLPLQEIIRQMNIHSNNYIAEMLASLVGGGAAVSQQAATVAQVPETEIQLINGSGLGVDNRISPRAACRMFLALEAQIKPYNLTVGDLFPVGSKDRHRGTMKDRNIPAGIAIKTGTLNQVSALAGLIPDEARGSVCFALINGGSGNIPYLRQQQDRFLQSLSQPWMLKDDYLDYAPPETLGDRDRITTFSPL